MPHILSLILLLSQLSYADAICNDNTLSCADKQGACSYHRGVKTWLPDCSFDNDSCVEANNNHCSTSSGGGLSALIADDKRGLLTAAMPVMYGILTAIIVNSEHKRQTEEEIAKQEVWFYDHLQEMYMINRVRLELSNNSRIRKRINDVCNHMMYVVYENGLLEIRTGSLSKLPNKTFFIQPSDESYNKIFQEIKIQHENATACITAN